MFKRDELTNPNSYLSKALDDEMMFALLGRDAAAPATIRFWIKERIRLGKNIAGDAQLTEAECCINVMINESHDWDPESGGGFCEPPKCRRCGVVANKRMSHCWTQEKTNA